MSGFNLSDWALKHRALLVYAMAVAVFFGVTSFIQLGRDEDPPFTFKTMLVAAQWPGATTQDTIAEVTDRIEKALQQTPQLDYLRSYTKPGETVVFVNLKDSTPASDVPGLWYRVRKEIGDIATTLPQGVHGPYFNDDFGDTYAIIYAFTADGFSQRELRDYVERTRTALVQVQGVAKVDLVGAQDETVYLEFSPKRLAAFNLDYGALLASLQRQNAVAPAGTIEANGDKVFVRVTGSFESDDAIRNLNIRVGDRFLRLGDLGNVRRGYQDPPAPQFRFNGKPAIGLALTMTKGGNVLDLGRNVAASMRSIKAELPIGVEPHLVADQGAVVSTAVGGFTEALGEAVLIVLGVSFLSLGFRAGLVVALAIPLVLAITFVVMQIMGIELQRISLGGLIIALGLLVDDAMITVEMMITKLEDGWDKVRAATYAYEVTAFPMLAGTLITAAGFVPIGFARSAAGEYTVSLFQVVTIALLVSWIVAVVFAPYLGVLLLRATPREMDTPSAGAVFFRTLLTATLVHQRRLVIVGVVVAFVASLGALQLVRQQFFPSSDRPELLVGMTLPQTATFSATAMQVDLLEKILAKSPDVDHWSFYVGQGAVRFYLPMDVQLANDNYAQGVVVAKDLKARKRLETMLESIAGGNFPNVIMNVTALELGPPVGWPIKFRVSGPDIAVVQRYADKVAALLGRDPAARNINFDWNDTARVLRVAIHQDQVRLLGLSSQAVADALNLVFTGQPITQMRDATYLINVTARAAGSERTSIDTLRNLEVQIPGGKVIHLGDIATFEYALEYPFVWRRNRLPTITVQAKTALSSEPAGVVADVAGDIAALRAQLPPGYLIETGGSVEESAKGQGSVFAVLPIAAFLILTIIMVMLQSFSRLLLVVSVAPLGLIGVAAALLLSGSAMGFVALLGVIALAGMIMRNSLILVTQIESNRTEGHKLWDAIIDATVHRMRPILLTAAAAILGMIPIAGEVFWGPMAFAIMGGLAVATVLTLIFLPALYAAWFRVKPPTPAH